MIQIAYISSATKPMSTEQLLALLQQCLASNARREVTGMLLYGNGTFVQALEGEEGVVDDLFAKIHNDPRHGNVQILHRKMIDRRQYSDWGMGFKRVSEEDLHKIEGLKDFSEKDFNADYLMRHTSVAESLLNHFGTPYWEPMVQVLEEKEQTIKHLKTKLAHTRGCVEVATLALESIVESGRRNTLDEAQLRLCELVLSTLRQA